MRKTVLVSLLSMLLALFVVGCGAPASESPADTADEVQNTETTDDEQAAEEPAADEQAAEEPAADEPVVEEEPEPEPEEVEKKEQVNEYDKPYVRGVVDGDTYRNETFGVGFTLPENYFFLADAELAEVFDESADLYTDEGIAERLGEGSLDGSMYCDMFAILEDDARADNLMLVVWKAPTYMSFTYSMYKPENYRNDEVNSYNAASEDSAEEFEAVATTVTVDGNEWPALDLTRTNKEDGSVVCQRIVYLRCGYHYARIIMSADSVEDLDGMTAHLFAL